jgi:hypothetical protein
LLQKKALFKNFLVPGGNIEYLFDEIPLLYIQAQFKINSKKDRTGYNDTYSPGQKQITSWKIFLGLLIF